MLAIFLRIAHNAPLLAGIAQLVEQLTCNQKVPSSTLGAGTNLIQCNHKVALYFLFVEIVSFLDVPFFCHAKSIFVEHSCKCSGAKCA